MGAARHFQSTQNNMYAISLQYLKPQISDEVNFLHVDKHQSFLKVDTIFFSWAWRNMCKLPRQRCYIIAITQERN